MNSLSKPLRRYDAIVMKNKMYMFFWILAFTGATVLIDKAVLYEWHTSDLISIIGIAINSILGLGLVHSVIRLIRDLDEVQRKIQIDALSFTIGITLIGSINYELLVTSHFIIDAEVSDITLFMVCTYFLSLIYGQVKYR